MESKEDIHIMVIIEELNAEMTQLRHESLYRPGCNPKSATDAYNVPFSDYGYWLE
jgi:hypothetical protein